MSRLTVFVVFVLAMTAIPAMADFGGSYVLIEYSHFDADGTESVFGTSEWDCGTGNRMYITYYKSRENGTGIVAGSYAPYDDVCFEMPICLELKRHENRIILSGTIKAYNVENNKISRGDRKVIYQDIEYNRQVSFKLNPSGTSNLIGINLKLVDKKPEPVVAEGPIALRTKFINVHDVFGYNTSSKSRIESRTNFQTSAEIAKDDGGLEKAHILTEILLPDYPQNLKQPLQTELQFIRKYKIDTSFVSNQEFTADITYESKYKRQVELIPGKTLLLVFPADTPSVRGFDREDTLIIKP